MHNLSASDIATTFISNANSHNHFRWKSQKFSKKSSVLSKMEFRAKTPITCFVLTFFWLYENHRNRRNSFLLPVAGLKKMRDTTSKNKTSGGQTRTSDHLTLIHCKTRVQCRPTATLWLELTIPFFPIHLSACRNARDWCRKRTCSFSTTAFFPVPTLHE